MPFLTRPATGPSRMLHRCYAARRWLATASTQPFVRPKSTQAFHIPTPPRTRSLHTTPTLLARKKGAPKKDIRITLIRYHLTHPLTPRPLRFSRNRSLRHWTIHRAWQLFRGKQRQDRELELERQFNSMRAACEALRLTGEHGLSVTEPGSAIPPVGARDPAFVTIERVPGKKDTEEMIDVRARAQRQTKVGRLYRAAMIKSGVWDSVPIEYARAQTDTPSKAGWDHEWTR